MPDIKFGTSLPTDSEKKAVDETIKSFGPVTLEITERLVYAGRQRTQERRHLLLPALHSLQNTSGWISPGGLDYVCRVLEIPPAEAYSVATFYHLFSSQPPSGNQILHVCDDIACGLKGAEGLIDDLKKEGYETKPSPCLGQCERGPAVFIQQIASHDSVVVDADLEQINKSLNENSENDSIKLPQAGSDQLRLLARVGIIDPNSLDDYKSHGGYKALTKALEMEADQIIEEVSKSGLRGRGGAAFPTGVKWKAVADEKGKTHHLVCNADESEPGTFKDRVLMENDPFALIESMTIAGIAIGAEKGWFYVRGEYPVARQRLSEAIVKAKKFGLLGDDILGSGKKFEIEIRSGAGAYICGEETALFNSIEGFRGEPRNKPPFPTTNGLFNEPTVVNNVETLANIPRIILDGGEAFAAEGTDQSSGTRLFCLSGRVALPGLYEFEFGATLGEILDAAGGFSGSGSLKTVLLGGAAGSFVTPESIDLPLTFEGTRDAGVSLGSGVIMAFSDRDELTKTVLRIAEFFRDESCGQCVPCRVGTVRQEELLIRIADKNSVETDISLFDDLAAVMSDASICGLGHTAASAVRSALNLRLLETQK
ncbi:MAG: NAD(P)H-dependent oxidoreductase subunit E [Acidimicrobiales bacterium]|jgi:NADH-quinone oxidoreductase subunit F|nr:NAD(P)H-dependent oxidoreductase subunit E [Acidimicrobiales bacterium]